MANLIHKTYEIRSSDEDRLICFAILQFPEHTNVKHWERISQKLESLLSRPEETTSNKEWKMSDLRLIVTEYISQHYEAGFTILWAFEGEADFTVRI